MPNWVTERSARYIHAEQIAEHGGLQGPSREGALEAALARPQNLLAHAKKEPSLQRLAAAYGFGLCKGHCFPDGNKRLGLATMDVFLRINGHQLTAPEEDAALTMLAVASDQMSERELTAWVEANSGPLIGE
jgi:death-on-curing protein